LLTCDSHPISIVSSPAPAAAAAKLAATIATASTDKALHQLFIAVVPPSAPVLARNLQALIFLAALLIIQYRLIVAKL
jgi:hypothetical protein